MYCICGFTVIQVVGIKRSRLDLVYLLLLKTFHLFSQSLAQLSQFWDLRIEKPFWRGGEISLIIKDEPSPVDCPLPTIWRDKGFIQKCLQKQMKKKLLKLSKKIVNVIERIPSSSLQNRDIFHSLYQTCMELNHRTLLTGSNCQYD